MCIKSKDDVSDIERILMINAETGYKEKVDKYKLDVNNTYAELKDKGYQAFFISCDGKTYTTKGIYFETVNQCEWFIRKSFHQFYDKSRFGTLFIWLIHKDDGFYDYWRDGSTRPDRVAII